MGSVSPQSGVRKSWRWALAGGHKHGQLRAVALQCGQLATSGMVWRRARAGEGQSYLFRADWKRPFQAPRARCRPATTHRSWHSRSRPANADQERPAVIVWIAATVRLGHGTARGCFSVRSVSLSIWPR